MLERASAVELLHLLHPRTHFLKTLPRAASILDMGAGDGSMAILRDWPAPARSDLKLYAVSLDKGAHFDKYDGYYLGNWEQGRPQFGHEVEFDCVMSSHFIEHISQPIAFLDWACSMLPRGGRIYLEWPTEMSRRLPSLQDFLNERIPLTISNFADDHTHLAIPAMADVCQAFRHNGYTVAATGLVRLPFLEEELLAHFLGGEEDKYAIQLAYWSKTGWAQYLVAERL